MTRPQLERMPGVTQRDIVAMMTQYRIDLEKIEGFDVRVLHPLPVNSEIAEIDYRVYFTPAQAFFAQAEYGIFLRKALLHEMLGHDGYRRYDGRACPRSWARATTVSPRRHPRSEAERHVHRQDPRRHGDRSPAARARLRAVSDALDLENRGYLLHHGHHRGEAEPLHQDQHAGTSGAGPEAHRPALARADDRLRQGRQDGARSSSTSCAPTPTASRARSTRTCPRGSTTTRGRSAAATAAGRTPYRHRKVSAEEERILRIGCLPRRIEPVVYPD